MYSHDQLMQEAFQEAIWAIGNSNPNPSVGAILYNPQLNKIVGRGFTQQSGQAHAEVMAIDMGIEKFSSQIVSESILYVTLEPCSHFGKTPPCSLKIIQSNIKEVHIGCLDPSEKVNSVEQLRQHNIQVFIEDKKKWLTEITYTLGAFFYKEKYKRPRMHLKWAQTKLGNLSPQVGSSGNISNSKSLEVMHRIRGLMHAVLVTPGTVVTDNPSLTTRITNTNLMLENTTFFTRIISRYERNCDKYYSVNAYRIFILPEFNEQWNEENQNQFIQKQKNLGGRYFFLTIDLNNYNNLKSNLQIHFIKNIFDLNEIVEILNIYDINEVMIEAGANLSDIYLFSSLIYSTIIFKTNNNKNWDNNGRGNTLSKELTTHSQNKLLNEIVINKNHHNERSKKKSIFILKEELKLDDDSLLIYLNE